MCGINGVSSAEATEEVLPMVIEDATYLCHVAQRGRDSSGVAFLNQQGGISMFKAVGPINPIVAMEAIRGEQTSAAVGHVRWASMGAVNIANAHPMPSEDRRFVLVHNGHIFNHNKLRRSLIKDGHVFVGTNDTEVLVHLFETYWGGQTNIEDLREAAVETLSMVIGKANMIFLFEDGTMLIYCDGALSFKKIESGFRFASQRTVGGQWKRLRPADLLIVKDGEILHSENIHNLKFSLSNWFGGC